MEDLKNRLTKELQQDFNVRVLDSDSWALPVQLISINFETVSRTKMDILMKMMLLTFQKTNRATIDELGKILLVEPLFIQDLIDKMLRSRMIEKNGEGFALTDKGMQQLETGIYEHEPETDAVERIYSPSHQSFLQGEIDYRFSPKDVYRYQDDFPEWEVAYLEEVELFKAIQDAGIEPGNETVQTVVTAIESTSVVKDMSVFCIEFRLYNKEEDTIYARVWNTLLGHWDDTIESQLNEKERKKWRFTYIDKQKES
ncbi:hypothetical protein JSQ81_02305 [Sporosarcina sp. Marseille-Q4063]|uniref:hypothetical protein n=1 Tax=Sporosarcina sp. Marseille-Q4063 TaxID=2810514 RepID=UPI001BB05CA6|nr:hypothetical protein [Sporosarcina sp. Marseille-Q4063]QUW22440.1 hypothetical protein JSQ81_02305 [Sporosarcina sp. Marseille-Q4063]